MRVIFLGTPAFAAHCLQTFLEAKTNIVAVYSQPARPAGRGKKRRPTDVAARAIQAQLPLFTPESLQTPEAAAVFNQHAADVAIVVAYGLRLPQAVLDAPRLGCLNLHASLLPRWRGAAPIHHAIMAGDEQSGVCVMKMTHGLDEGPVLLKKEIPIAFDETTGGLHDRLAAVGAPLLIEALDRLESLALAPVPQSTEGVTYAHKINKAEARIDWRLPAVKIDRKIRGLSPSPGAWSKANLGGNTPVRLKILMSQVENGADVAPGTTLDDRLLIQAGDSYAVRIMRLQRPGKQVQSANDFLRGSTISKGHMLFPHLP